MNSRQLTELGKRLGSASSDVRYQAFLDADALDDEDFLFLLTLWKDPHGGLLDFWTLWRMNENGNSEFRSRSLARLMRNRTDVRLLPYAVMMRENLNDEDTREYLFDVYEKLLLRLEVKDANLLRKHQPVFVHCNLGSARTGTVIACHRILRFNQTR